MSTGDNPRLSQIVPSCGKILLQSGKNNSDYTLYIVEKDGKKEKSVRILTHRCILGAYSERLNRMISDDRYFSSVLQVATGYTGAMLQLIQYMYLNDPSLITDHKKVVELCGLLEMKGSHTAIRFGTLVKSGDVGTVKIDLADEPGTFVACIDLMKRVEVNGQIALHPKVNTTQSDCAMNPTQSDRVDCDVNPISLDRKTVKSSKKKRKPERRSGRLAKKRNVRQT